MPANTRWALVAATSVLTALILMIAYFARSPRSAHTSTPAPKSALSIAAPPNAPTPAAHPFVTDVSPPAPAAPGPPSITDASLIDPRNVSRAVSGLVTDRLGKPIARATVFSIDVQSSAFTGDDGRYAMFNLQPGKHELIAVHEQYSDSNRVTVQAGTEGVNFSLPPAAAIEGSVVDAADGRPITEFKIYADALPRHPLRPEKKPKKIKDAEGRFSLDPERAGVNTISVSAKGYADAAIPIPALVAGEFRDNVELRLEAGAVIEGRIVDARGENVKLAQIYTSKPRRGAVSDLDGTFRFDSLPTGPIELTVKHESYGQKSVNINVSRGTVNRARIVLGIGAVLEGEVTQGGKGVPGDIHVFLPLPQNRGIGPEPLDPKYSEPIRQARAGGDGHYRIVNMPEGPVRVEATFDDAGSSYTTWRKTTSITVAPGSAPVLDFDFPAVAATVQGNVFTAPDKTFDGEGSFMTSFQDFNADGPSQMMMSARLVGGSYVLRLPAGPVGLFLSLYPNPRYDGPSHVQFKLDLRSGDHIGHNIYLYGGTTLRVKLSGGEAPERMTVLVLQGEVVVGDVNFTSLASVKVEGQGSMDAKGTASVWGLAPGTYTVVALQFARPGLDLACLGSAVVTVGKDQEVAVPIQRKDK